MGSSRGESFKISHILRLDWNKDSAILKQAIINPLERQKRRSSDTPMWSASIPALCRPPYYWYLAYGVGDKWQIDQRNLNLISIMDRLELDKENKLATLPMPLASVS